MIQRRLWLAGVACFCMVSSGPAMAAGQYKLAWWRQLGNYENGAGSGCTGNHVMNVWVFDEYGLPKGNVSVMTTWGAFMGTTPFNGPLQIIIDNNNTRYDLRCSDASGSTSDVAYDLSSRLRPCWGHYGFEVGFLYKTNAGNPGNFDTGLNCTLNSGCTDYATCPETLDAPYTRSLAYNSINCADYLSDQFDLGNWQPASSYFGQTFVATGNRVVAMRAHCTIGGNYTLAFKAQIVTWPGMQPVGPARQTPTQYPFGWVVSWGVNDVPVVPGQTYMLKIWRDGDGMNSYHIPRNNYANGQYYEGTTAYPGYELEGWVCCMNTAVNITAAPSVTGVGHSSATITWDTDVASDSRVDYGPTTSYGLAASDSPPVTRHSIRLTGLAAESTYHYKVTSAAFAYTPGVSTDLTFTTLAPKPVGDFDQDGDVDMEDFSHLQECLGVPTLSLGGIDCTDADFDGDTDVDGDDVLLFAGCLSAPNQDADPYCAP